MKRTKYEVFVDSVYGSDVLTYDTYKEAFKAAEDWLKDLKKGEKIVILKVTEEIATEITK